MSHIRTVAVFCGAQPGDDPIFRAQARSLGEGLAARHITLVFGGGRVGLMGAVADGALEAGGDVIGVIPEFLTRLEVAHEGVPDMLIVDSMHTRKRLMFELSDAFVSMPGGLGTLDETIEIITWRQLGLHDKPVLICDVDGSAAPMLAMMDHAIGRGFARPEIRRLWERHDGVPAVLARLETLGQPHEADAARL